MTVTRLLVFVLFAVASAACGDDTAQLEDLTGVASLSPGLSELICELGAEKELIAVDQYSSWPESLAAKRNSGGIKNLGSPASPDLEMLARLKPEHIIIERTTALVDLTRFENLGVEVHRYPYRSLNEMTDAWLDVGRTLGREKAAKSLVEKLDKELSPISFEKPPRILVLYRSVDVANVSGPGPESYQCNMLERMGAKLALPADAPVTVQLSPERLFELDPDLVIELAFTESSGSSVAEDWQSLASLPAMERGDVVRISGRHTHSLGPSMMRLAAELRKSLIGWERRRKEADSPR